jgi:hypothetical protein
MKCISDRLLVNLNKLNKKNENKSNNENEQIEGFFGGLGSWFSGSTPSNLPAISPGSLPTENIHLLEKKIQSERNDLTNIDELVSKEYTDINKYNRHTKEHTKYLSKISQTLQQEDKNRENTKLIFPINLFYFQKN